MLCRVERTGCASHCPERLRGFFVYTGGSVLLVETHALSPNRATSGRNPFLTHLTVSGSYSVSRSHLQLISHVRSCDRQSAAAQIHFRSDTSRCLPGSVGNGAERRGSWDFLRLRRGSPVGFARLNERGGAGLEWNYGARYAETVRARLHRPGSFSLRLPERRNAASASVSVSVGAIRLRGKLSVCDAAACVCAVRVCSLLIMSKCCCTSSWTLVRWVKL